MREGKNLLRVTYRLVEYKETFVPHTKILKMKFQKNITYSYTHRHIVCVDEKPVWQNISLFFHTHQIVCSFMVRALQ